MPSSNKMRAAKWVGLGVAGAVLSTLVGAGVLSIGGALWNNVHPPPPPPAQQLERLIVAASRQGMRLSYNNTADLRGTGEASRIVVFSPAFTTPAAEKSEQLRIYDVRSGLLKEVFRFVPTEQERFRGRTWFWRYDINVLAVTDINGDQGAEILVDFQKQYADALVSHPFVISWEASRDRYRVVPVFGRAALRLAMNRSHPGSQIFYNEIARIYNASDPRQRFQSVGAEYAEVVRADRHGADIAALFVVSALDRARPLEMQVGFWSIDTSYGGDLVAFSCLQGSQQPGVSTHPILVKVVRNDSQVTLVRRGFRKFKRYDC